MTRAMRLLGLAMVVTAALAAPSAASAANWKENGAEITDFGPHWLKSGGSLTSSANLELEGTYNFTSSAGGVNCSAAGAATIEPGSSGAITSLNLTGCKGTGALNGCTVTSATSAPGPYFTAGEGGVVKIIGANSTYKLSGFLCPKEVNVVQGTVTATPDNSAKMSSLTLSGTGKLGIEGKPTGENAAVNGTLAVKPGATYGVGAGPTVAYSGSFSHLSAQGGLSCSVTGSLRLQAAGAGQVTAQSWNCFTSGGWAFTCGNVTSVTSNSLPWAVQNEGTTIKISGVSFTVNMQKCTWNVSGTITGTPDKAGAISSVSLSGSLQTAGFGGTWQWNGSQSWTPAGWYGL